MTDDEFGDCHVADQVICADKIAGRLVLTDPNGGPRRDGTEPGLLYVEKRADGRWYDPEYNSRIEAREFASVLRLHLVGAEPPGNWIGVTDAAGVIFIPNPGEVERVGMWINRLYLSDLKGRNLALELRAAMDDDERRPEEERQQGPSPKTEELRELLIWQWAEPKGMFKARGAPDWRRLVSESSGVAGGGLPGDDHVTMWSKFTDPPPRRVAIWVSQPCSLSSKTLREMADFADAWGLIYTISTWPAWHCPGSVLFVEWSAPHPRLRQGALPL
jgi:hypothetical protein